MSKKKSIVSSFGLLNEKPIDSFSSETSNEISSTPPKQKRIAAGVIGATQRSLTEIREERDRLLEVAKSGHQLLTLDPLDIDPSPFRDRLPDDDDADYERFKKSLKDEGQKTPISVRRHPQEEHRYQVVFGHRRWRAAKELGIKVEAKLGEVNDRDLVVAQGIENANRQDLSWIEKALFSHEMENAGIKAKDIRAALSVDDAQLSKFRLVVKTLGEDIICLIGRAPKIGRPRWIELAELVKSEGLVAKLKKTLSNDKVFNLDSDQKFLVALDFMAVKSKPKKASGAKPIHNNDSVGSLTFENQEIRIILNPEHVVGFKMFLEREFEDIKKRYLASIDK